MKSSAQKQVFTCPLCGFTKWDGQHGHPFGGERKRGKTLWCLGLSTPELDKRLTQAMLLGVQYTLHLLGVDRDKLLARFVEQEFQSWVRRYQMKVEGPAAIREMSPRRQPNGPKQRKPPDTRWG